MSEYAQIPTHLICRFGELSKTEIRVFCYLHATRNRKTGQCNPSRNRIAAAIGEAPAHLTPAIRNLIKKGWVSKDKNGNFLFETVALKGTKTVPARGYENGTEGGTDSVTGGYENGNLHIKEEQKKEQKNLEQSEGAPEDPVAIYFEFFPKERITIYQQELITDRVSDFERWRRALTKWKANDYKARNVGNILGHYDELEGMQNGTAQKPSSAADRNRDRIFANEQLGQDLRDGKLDDLLDELYRRDPLSNPKGLLPGEPPALDAGSIDLTGQRLD